MEPRGHKGYSDHRPDLLAEGRGKGGVALAGDLKVYDDLGSSGVPGMRGGIVGFGNTQPAARALVNKDYKRAIGVHGVDVRCLLTSTLGGFGPELCEFLHELAAARNNKLSSAEYDATTWSARTWLTFSCHKLSVALHRGAAWEIAHALDLSVVVDGRA